MTNISTVCMAAQMRVRNVLSERDFIMESGIADQHPLQVSRNVPSVVRVEASPTSGVTDFSPNL